MQEQQDYSKEVFIDAESGFQNEKNTFETIIILQIKACADILSREMTGGQVMVKTTKTGATEKYVEDVKELVINHVDTMRMLMTVYIKKDKTDEKDIKKIIEDIETYKDKVGKIEVIVEGKGRIPLKDVKGIHADNPIWKEYLEYKARKYREMFEVLVRCFNKNKSLIRSLETE